MPRPRNQFPELKFHNRSRQWCIYRDNQRIPLGRDRTEAEARRLRLIAEWHGQTVEVPTSDQLTVAEALTLYHNALEGRCDPRKLSRIRMAIAATVKSHGHKMASNFKGRSLKEVRESLVKRTSHGRPLSRRYINHLVDALVLAFRWLAANEYIPVANVDYLREMSKELAETDGRESPVIAAVPDAIVEATLPHCLPVVAAMIQVQRATGMRPGELCSMKRSEISIAPDAPIPVAGMEKHVAAMAFNGSLIWLYCPSKHKNLHRRKPRVIALGADAQEHLRPLLGTTGHIFRNRFEEPYTPATYGGSVARAANLAGVGRWSPNQLRKAAAKRIEMELNPDRAAAMLGHSASRQALDFYLAEQIEKAVEAAAKAG